MKPAIRASYERQIAKIEAEIVSCQDDNRRAVLERSLEIERALLARLER
jgi:hypothetical protein